MKNLADVEFEPNIVSPNVLAPDPNEFECCVCQDIKTECASVFTCSHENDKICTTCIILLECCPLCRNKTRHNPRKEDELDLREKIVIQAILNGAPLSIIPPNMWTAAVSIAAFGR